MNYKRDYWARDCRLTITPIDGKPSTIQLDDFAPRSNRIIDLNSLTCRCHGVFVGGTVTTHAGLPNQAAGAWPDKLEQFDFLERPKGRDTYSFLSELFDTEVLTADGKPAPRTLAEMTNGDGITPVALHSRRRDVSAAGARENPSSKGPLRGESRSTSGLLERVRARGTTRPAAARRAGGRSVFPGEKHWPRTSA